MTDELFHVEYSERNEEDMDEREVATAIALAAAAQYYIKKYTLARLRSILSQLRSMNTASKLGLHTQTDRGTCPGVGL